MPFVFVTGAASQYLGAAIGVFLFSTTQPATVAWLRAAAGALVLAAWRRPWRMRLTRRRVTVATLFGLITVGMNIAFYEALARIPLGTAVAVEFIGPTLVATLGSRRPRDLLAAGLAAGGVALLAGIELTSELAGVAWALAAAALWAGYILVGKRVADAHGGWMFWLSGCPPLQPFSHRSSSACRSTRTRRCSSTPAPGCSVWASDCCRRPSPTASTRSSSARSAKRGLRSSWRCCR
ncbi:hypothetical protein NCCNTM_40750 [Mycolicibacterium sp. NCC-Tsukiji]|nr:hypothetical protein NCCNTM_40750 [Mycolicibacterium sp. NCC-Tsukiji]